MLMLVSLGDPETQRKQRLSEVLFWIFTLTPWAAMIWLLWPRW